MEFGEPGGEWAGIDGCGALKASGAAEILQTPESASAIGISQLSCRSVSWKTAGIANSCLACRHVPFPWPAQTPAVYYTALC